MTATSLRVSLLAMTPDAEALIYAACKQCTSQDDAADVYKRLTVDPVVSADHVNKLIRRVIDSGHTSVVEHVPFSFAISGVSRALSHQLVRHRIASYSQQSQRYVKADDFDYVMPPHVEAIPEAKAKYKLFMSKAQHYYSELQHVLAKNGHKESANEDARFVLPNACATKLVVTMNARSLLHFFEERLCKRAQWEIRAMAKAMYDICLERLPVVFAGRGPKCKRLGFCTEHNSCGMMPKRGE